MKPLIVANWKCNPTTGKEAKALFNSIGKGIKNVEEVKVVICPPFVYLANLQLTTYNLKLGAQDCFGEGKGAFTGEISPVMLKNLGVDYVIIGHSERRKYQKETDEMINKKLKTALKTGLKVILCIDNISQIPSFLRKRGGRRGRSPLRRPSFLRKRGLVKKELANLIIAYEPIFAVGTGKPCPVEKANKMRTAIKKEVFDKNIPILYGGSVNFRNAGDYIKKGGFQGLLIGSTSLNAKEFIKIVKDIDLN